MNFLDLRRYSFPFAFIAVACAFALVSLGCSADPRPAPKMAEAMNGSAAAVNGGATSPAASSSNGSSVHVDDAIVAACSDIPVAHFAFDSSSLGAQAESALDALVRCFTTGKLRGRAMRLTGLADPRGELDYNLGLGQRRAGSVARYLGEKGLERGRVQTTSRGALDATGTDEEGWARDRRVDVTLID